jgi:MFS family permease
MGSVIAGPISNWIGRRDSIFFACLWWLLGTAVQTGTNGFGMLIAGRVLNGVCVGITSSQVPVYLAEIAKKEKRGAVVIIQQLAIGETHPQCFQVLFANPGTEWGIFIMYFIGYGCEKNLAGPAAFRAAWGTQFIP